MRKKREGDILEPPAWWNGEKPLFLTLFEELGFETRHAKEGISINNVTDVRMKDADGFHVDITQGHGEWTMIRMNVDNLEEAIEFLEARGFHKARHAAAHDTIDIEKITVYDEKLAVEFKSGLTVEVEA